MWWCGMPSMGVCVGEVPPPRWEVRRRRAGVEARSGGGATTGRRPWAVLPGAVALGVMRGGVPRHSSGCAEAAEAREGGAAAPGGLVRVEGAAGPRGMHFALLVPEGWAAKAKPGAAAYFEDPARKYTNVAVAVLPVRVGSLGELGTLDEVGAKLIGAELAKDITREARLVSQGALGPAGGEELYVYEYECTTDYGAKAIASGVTVRGGSLYNVNVTHGRSGLYGESLPEEDALYRAVVESLTVAV